MTPAERKFLLSVDAGFAHSKPVSAIRPGTLRVVHSLASDGYIRLESPRGRFPLRWIVTNRGLFALGTFAAIDEDMRRRRAA